MVIVQSASRLEDVVAEVETEIVVTVREVTEDVMLVRARMAERQESLRLHCKLSIILKEIFMLMCFKPGWIWSWTWCCSSFIGRHMDLACLHRTEISRNTLTKVGLNSSAFGRVIAIAGDDRSKLEDDTSKLSDSIMSFLPLQSSNSV